MPARRDDFSFCATQTPPVRRTGALKERIVIHSTRAAVTLDPNRHPGLPCRGNTQIQPRRRSHFCPPASRNSVAHPPRFPRLPGRTKMAAVPRGDSALLIDLKRAMSRLFGAGEGGQNHKIRSNHFRLPGSAKNNCTQRTAHVITFWIFEARLKCAG